MSSAPPATDAPPAPGWREDRWSWLVVAVGAVVACLAWAATTRPMGDSPSYRAAGLALSHGWSVITDRTPGYPLLLWLTGSLRHETTLLFLVQLALHVTTVVLVVRVAGRVGVPPGWRVAVAVLLVAPAPMVKVVYAGSEALAEVLVAVVLWTLVRWLDDRRGRWLVGAGVAIGALSLTRPTFVAVVLPLGLLVWWLARRDVSLSPSRSVLQIGTDPSRSAAQNGRGAARPVVAVACLAAPVVVLVGALVLSNGLRFGSWGTTPLLGWYLGSRTSSYVQELPRDPDGVRDLLVRERDRRLLLGPGTDAENYQFGIRDELSHRTGLRGTALDARMWDLNTGLIRGHPFEYLDAVSRSAERYVQIGAQPAAAGPMRLGAWAQDVVHLLLVLAFAVALVTVPGLALRGEVAPRLLATLAVCAGISLTCFAVSCLIETGSSRLRAPTDPLLVLLLVAGWWILVDRQRAARRVAGLDGAA